MTVFWLNDPSVLIKINDFSSFFPDKNHDIEDKLNSITRTIIILTSLGFLLTKSENILTSGLLTLAIIIGLYYTKQGNVTNINSIEGYTNPETYRKIKENFTVPNDNNPLMNVSPIDYSENPDKKIAVPSYNKCVSDDINKKVKKRIEKNLDANNRMFNNLGDNLVFDQSMRNFYTTPSTQIPNDQKSFIDFCYGDLPSCKDGTYVKKNDKVECETV